MKNGKRLFRKNKELLAKLGLNPNEYLLERQDGKSYRFINTSNGEVEKFTLDGSRLEC
ncbi:MAG: DUF6906 family protein [Fusobacteriaceae bacterium]|uniref:DUF6906 family protein n=1 Tax=Romboutsia sp. TaxID=1965302 RepID=UPI003F2F942A